MKDLFLKRKQEFRKECLAISVMCSMIICLIFVGVIRIFGLPVQPVAPTLPENHFPILILIGIISILLFALGWYCDLSRST